MLRSPVARAVGVVVLLAGLFGLAVWFGSLPPAPELGAYPANDHHGPDYDRYVGERIVFFGEIQRTDPVVVGVSYGIGGYAEYTVRGVDRSVEPGNPLWVYGVAEPDRTVRAIGVVAQTEAGFAYARWVSLLAGLWVLARILRDWDLDGAAVGLAPAEERTRDQATPEDDA